MSDDFPPMGDDIEALLGVERRALAPPVNARARVGSRLASTLGITLGIGGAAAFANQGADAGADPSGIDPSGIDPTGIDPTGIDPSGVDLSGMDGADLGSAALGRGFDASTGLDASSALGELTANASTSGAEGIAQAAEGIAQAADLAAPAADLAGAGIGAAKVAAAAMVPAGPAATAAGGASVVGASSAVGSGVAATALGATAATTAVGATAATGLLALIAKPLVIGSFVAGTVLGGGTLAVVNPEVISRAPSQVIYVPTAPSGVPWSDRTLENGFASGAAVHPRGDEAPLGDDARPEQRSRALASAEEKTPPATPKTLAPSGTPPRPVETAAAAQKSIAVSTSRPVRVATAESRASTTANKPGDSKLATPSTTKTVKPALGNGAASSEPSSGEIEGRPKSQAPAPSRPPRSELAKEQALLELARTALTRRNPLRALSALQRHESRFPEAQLTEEREVLFILALVGAGRDDEAAVRARRFKRTYPRSMQLPIVEGALR